MEIDKQTIRALSADTRIRILKILFSSRKIAADISKELGLAPSTVNEHLKTMESAGLVKKRDTGHKWIYYEITDKGTGLIKPKMQMQFVLVLSLGLAMAFFGILSVLFPNQYLYGSQAMASSEAGKISGAITETAPSAVPMPVDWLSVAAAVIGMALILVASYKLLRRG